MLDIVFIVIGIIWVAFSLATLSLKVKHMGVWLPLISGGAMIFFGAIDVFMLVHFVWWNGVSMVFSLFFCSEILFTIFVSSIMFFGWERFHGDCHGETIVILGCRVRGDKPSKMLTRRLEHACIILGENPDTICITSGGQGDDEEYPEAQVMRNFLVERGIHPQRILEECKSRNTYENLKFTEEIITKQNCNKKIIIVTDFYHQYRANLFAYRNGLHSIGSSCHTNPALAFSYWIREILATTQTFILQK